MTMSVHEHRGAWQLADLFAGIAEIRRTCAQRVTGLASDSRRVAPGDVFFARRGARTDGSLFIAEAVRRGAVAVVREGVAAVVRRGTVTEIRVPELRACMGAVANRYHGAPSRAMRVLAVTGTNGKSSVCHLLAHALDRDPAHGDQRCAQLGTLGWGLPGALADEGLTTPEVLELHRMLAELRAAGAGWVAMEASSHGLDQGRVAGVHFDTAVFTNLSRDHLDYHGDLRAYGAAKGRLFESAGLRCAVINVADPFGRRISRDLPGRIRRLRFALDGDATRGEVADIVARLSPDRRAGLCLQVATPAGQGELRSPLIGDFNARNLLAALGVMLGLGMELDAALQRLAAAPPVPGRMQIFGGDEQCLAVVDFAHTPDALEHALRALRPLVEGHLWCVFGCGGERDQGKRALMGAVAEAWADRVLLTDDNPRGEDGDAIVAAIRAGMRAPRAAIVERDRGAAIARALTRARPGDVVLIAGKGHERHQIQGARRLPFSDVAAVRAVLARGSR